MNLTFLQIFKSFDTSQWLKMQMIFDLLIAFGLIYLLVGCEALRIGTIVRWVSFDLLSRFVVYPCFLVRVKIDWESHCQYLLSMWLLWLFEPRLHSISRLVFCFHLITFCVPLPPSLTVNLFLLLSHLHRFWAVFAAWLSSTVMPTATRSHSVNICTAFRGNIGDPTDDHPSIHPSIDQSSSPHTQCRHLPHISHE